MSGLELLWLFNSFHLCPYLLVYLFSEGRSRRISL